MVIALREVGPFGGEAERFSSSLVKPASGDVLTNVLAGLTQSSESYGHVYGFSKLGLWCLERLPGAEMKWPSNAWCMLLGDITSPI